MSYDLVFWKQTTRCTAEPANIYADLLGGKTVDGLETIPTGEILARIRLEFSGIREEGGLVCWEGDEQGMFELYSSDQHVHACCREMTGDDMNKLIDIAAEFQCPLYDPQDNKRYV